MARVEGSLRYYGYASIGTDKVTKARIKRLAGDTPISVFVRELVDMAEGGGEGGGAQAPLPGQERYVSGATLSSISSKLDRFMSAVILKAESLDVEVNNALYGEGEWHEKQTLTFNEAVEALSGIVRALKSKVELQGSLFSLKEGVDELKEA